MLSSRLKVLVICWVAVVVVAVMNGGTGYGHVVVVVVVDTVPVDEPAALAFMLVPEMSNSTPPTQLPHCWL